MPVNALLHKVAAVAVQTAVLYGLSRVLFFLVLQAVASRQRGGGRLIRLLRLPGNLVHELGHATGYLLFGYRVKRLVTCTRDPEGRGLCAPGKPWSPLAVPWLATAAAAVLPLVFGTLVLRGLAAVLGIRFPDAALVPADGGALYLWDSVRETLFSLAHHGWGKYVFLLLGFSIGAELAPSETDMRRGLLPLMLTAAVLAVLTVWFGRMHAGSLLWTTYSGWVDSALGWLSPLLVFGITATALVAVLTVPAAIAVRLVRKAFAS